MTTMMNAVLGAVLSMAVGATAVAVPLETSPRPGEVRETASGREGTSGSPPPTAQPPVPSTPPVQPVPPVPAARPAGPQDVRARARARAAARVQRGPWVYATGEPLSATFTAAPGDIVELVNTSGDVVVIGGRGREGRIVAHRKAGGRTHAEAQALVEQVQVQVDQHPQRVVIRSLPTGKANAYRLDYEITLPEGAGVNVRNVSGSVSVDGVSGDVRIEAVSGDITGKGLGRARSLRTMSGNITLADSTIEGEADLQTVSGDVVASALKARALTLGSVSGDVHLTDAACERVTVRTVSGDIEFASPAVGGGRYELKSHAGAITVITGGRSAGFAFEAQTFKGHIRADAGTTPAGATSGQRLTGRVGDGSAYFELSSFVGDIVIER